MTISFRPAIRENVSLLIGLAGSSGSGKTYTSFRLAKGIAGDKPFAVIDTEAGRAKHYADDFRFDHCDLAPPFRPGSYADAIAAADKAGYPVIVVDSMSHEWAGQGGILDWQEEEFERLGKKDSIKLLSWSKPKQAHKEMVQRLLQVRAHLILCFRAEEKIDMIKEDGKTKIVPKEGPGGFKGWLPICEKNLPYELTTSFLLLADAPGVPKPIKLQQQHRELFPAGQVINEECGRRIAEWARGEKHPVGASSKPLPATEVKKPDTAQPEAQGASEFITPDQVADLEALCGEHGVPVAKLRTRAGVSSLQQIASEKFRGAVKWVKNGGQDKTE